MKTALFLLLAGLSSVALAGPTASAASQVTAPQTQPLTQEYDYSVKLDIAKVLAVSEVPNVCAVVPARMTYLDSKGTKHILEYQVMGNGCSNG